MTHRRKILAIIVVTAALMGLAVQVAYVLKSLGESATGESVVLFDPLTPELSKGDPRHRAWLRRSNILETAELPWQRDVLRPAECQVAAAAHPWVRSLDVPGAVKVAVAELPRLRPLRVVSRPEPVRMAVSAAPWVRDVDHPLAASVEAAVVPRIRPRGDLRKPTAVRVEPAFMPELKPRRNPRRPLETKVFAAGIPWVRDVSSPATVEMETARVPSRLDHLSTKPSK